MKMLELAKEKKKPRYFAVASQAGVRGVHQWGGVAHFMGEGKP